MAGEEEEQELPPILIISLPGDPRRARMDAVMARLGLTPRYVDGVRIKDYADYLEWCERLQIAPRGALPDAPGNVGFTLAWLNLVHTMVVEGVQAALVLEDDAEVTSDAAIARFALAPRAYLGHADVLFVHPHAEFKYGTQAQVLSFAGALKLWKARDFLLHDAGCLIDIAIMHDRIRGGPTHATAAERGLWPLFQQNEPFNDARYSRRLQLCKKA